MRILIAILFVFATHNDSYAFVEPRCATPSIVGTWRINAPDDDGVRYRFEPDGRVIYLGRMLDEDVGHWTQSDNRITLVHSSGATTELTLHRDQLAWSNDTFQRISVAPSRLVEETKSD